MANCDPQTLITDGKCFSGACLTPDQQDIARLQLLCEIAAGGGGGAGALLKVNNLSDVDDVAASRLNLGLGDSATRNVGTTAGTVADGGLVTDLAGLSVKSYGAIGDGVTDDTAAVNLAIAAAAASGSAVVFPPGTYKVTGSSISTTSVQFRFEGGIANVVTGTWTVNGGFQAAPVQVISSSLSTPITFNRGNGDFYGPGNGIAMDHVYAEWFGAKGDNTTDNVLYLQQWLNSGGNGLVMTLAGGKYNTSGQLVMPGGTRFNTYEGNSSRITYTGAAAPGSAVLLMSNANGNSCSRLEFNRITFNANSLAGYSVALKHSAGTPTTFTGFTWRNCYFTNATVTNFLMGDQSSSGQDYDCAAWTFDSCVWLGITGGNNVVVDGSNIVGVAFRSCLIGASSPAGGSRPLWNVRLLTGATVNFDNCFFDRVDRPGYSIYNKGCTVTFNSTDTECARFLWQESGSSTIEPNSLETVINTLRISNAGTETASNEYAIYATAGTVRLNGALLNAAGSGSRFGVRVDSRLSTNASWLAGTLTAGVPTPTATALANPQRCDIDGIQPATWRSLMMNGNPYLNLWSGSASGDLPIGYSLSASGTFTVQRAGISSADWPKTNFGRYCAKITVTNGAISGSVIDGLLCRVRIDSRRGPGPYAIMVSGYVEGMTGATAPKVSAINYTWGGAAWNTGSSNVRSCWVDGTGRFWGVITLAPASGTESGYIDAYVGMGTAGAAGTIYLSEFIIARMDGEALDAGSSHYPGFGRLFALSTFPKQVALNTSFANGSDYWTVGSGWSVAAGNATHTNGGGTNSLSQDIGYAFQSRRMFVSVTVSGRTSGTVTPKVCGTSGTAISANGQSIQEIYAGNSTNLLEFVPTNDFDGSITAIFLQSPRVHGDDDGGIPWVASGQVPIGNQGMNLVAGNQNLNPNRITLGSAAPTVGDYKVGDIVYNSAPAAGSPDFWQCTASGTPGTWLAENATKTFTGALTLDGFVIDTSTYSSQTFARITATNAAANVNVILDPKGSGFISARMPDGTTAGGNQRGTYAVDFSASSGSDASYVASGSYSFAVGNIVKASGTSSFAAGGAVVASGDYSAGFGNLSTASGTNAFAACYQSTASGNHSVAFGYQCTASGLDAFCCGESSTASARSSFASGQASFADKTGQHAHSAGLFASSGDAQRSHLVARNSTSNATPTNLFLDGSSARITIPANTTWEFEVHIVARTASATGTYAKFVRSGVLSRNSTAGSTAIATVDTVGTDRGSNAGSPPAGWAVALTADTTNAALDIQVTGAAATNIRWVAHIMLTEVAYA